MDKKVRITGALDDKKLNEMDVEKRNDFISRDVERIMKQIIDGHAVCSKDEENQEKDFYNKDDWYSVRAIYTKIDSYYNNKGTLTAMLAYNYVCGAKIKSVKQENA